MERLMLPRAVREQAERADAAHEALINGTLQQATPPEEQTPATAEPTPQPDPETPKATTPPVEPVAIPDPWELKYRALQGKYNAEVPRSAARIRELEEQLRTAPTPAQTPTDAPTPATAAIRDQYGDDFASAVEALADAKIKKLRDEFSSKVESVEAATGQQARTSFMRELGSLIPNFAAVDQEPGFTVFLDEFDAMTGRTRREFFNEADRQNDAARVASFFAGYLGSKTPAAPAPAAPPSPAHLITPDSSRASEAPPGKRHWTKSDINRFYRESSGEPQPGKHYGRYTVAEYTAIDSDITAAASEGRISG